MKAIVYTGYGSADVLQCVEIENPSPKDNEVLISVRAASANAPDWRIMSGKPFVLRMMFGLRKPKIRPGADVAGVAEAVGKNVTRFKPGDAVFGMCRGAFAEYACASESNVVVKPENVTFEQAGSVPEAALTALQGLRNKGRIGPGQRVLINGASGGVGTFAVQIARSFGADITGVCSTRNSETVLSIGAARVVDYTREDFTTSGQRYDLILDCVGNHSLAELGRALNFNGICVIAGAPKTMSTLGLLATMIKPMVVSRFGSQKFATFIARPNKRDLTFICELMEAGKVTPVIDRRYPLSEVSEAIRYLADGHARGKVVIAVERHN